MNIQELEDLKSGLERYKIEEVAGTYYREKVDYVILMLKLWIDKRKGDARLVK